MILVVGPNFDIDLKVFHNGDEAEHPPGGVVVERLIPHVGRAKLARNNIMCVAVPVEERDKRYIMYSGNGRDLILEGK